MGGGRDADQRLRGKGVAEQATGGEEWFLESAGPVRACRGGHQDVLGVEGGLLVGWKDVGGMGR